MWSRKEAIEWAESEGHRWKMVEITGDGFFIEPGGLDGYADDDIVFGALGYDVKGWMSVGEIRRNHRLKVAKGNN